MYSAIPVTIAGLREDILYRESLRRVVLAKLWETIDPVLSSLELMWYNESQSTIQQLIYQVVDGETSLNVYRHQKLMKELCQRFVQACIAVVDGRFTTHLKENHISSICQ